MEILIVGTGALATLFAGRLARAGHSITMLGTWAPGLAALRERGASSVNSRGVEESFPVHVAESSRACGNAKHAIVLVKSWQTERAARQLAEILSSDGLALTLQNGLGNYETLVHSLGKERVALGTTTTGATLLGPGLVRPAGDGTISIQAHERLGNMGEALISAGFAVDVVADASALLWNKLIVNSAINPLTALLKIPNGELLNRPAARALMHTLADETALVAYARGIRLNIDDVGAMVEDVARRTAGNYSSMLQDVLRGAPTEIDAICGAVTRIGRQNGVPTPVNEACWQLIQSLAQSTAGGATQPLNPSEVSRAGAKTLP